MIMKKSIGIIGLKICLPEEVSKDWLNNKS